MAVGATRWSERTATLDFGSTREVKVEWVFGSEVAELQMTCNVSPGGTGSWGEPKSDTAAGCVCRFGRPRPDSSETKEGTRLGILLLGEAMGMAARGARSQGWAHCALPRTFLRCSSSSVGVVRGVVSRGPKVNPQAEVHLTLCQVLCTKICSLRSMSG